MYDEDDSGPRAAPLAPAPRALDTEVRIFAREMQRELNANSPKGDAWRLASTDVLLAELDLHVAKVKHAIAALGPARIREHAADVANCALFIAWRKGDLES